MRNVLFLIGAFFSGVAFAAPDEAVLGKAEGYPVCSTAGKQSCLVGQLSHYDEIYPARKVAKGAAVRELKRAPKEADGVNVNAFLDSNRNTGFLLMKGDTILAERYQYDRKPADRFQSYSMAKTVVAMLIGIAVFDKQISSIDDRAEKYVPALKGQPYGETSLRHLLTMSSGVRFREDYDGKDDISVLGRKTIGQQGPGGADTVATFTDRARAAGEKFYYASAETQVLGLVLRAAVGVPLADYLSEKIWQPMGAEADATWQIDRGGYETGFMGINATLRDWGRLGLLLANDGALCANDGKLDCRQIIPADWVKAATTPDSAHLRPGIATGYMGYGYQTWLLPGGGRRFALLGVRGQAVFVDPASKLVVVHTAVHEGSRDPARGNQFSLWSAVLRVYSD